MQGSDNHSVDSREALMKTIRFHVITAAATLLCATVGFAQTPSPSSSQTDPSAASSPSQRAATHNNSTETPTTEGSNPASASTPAQRDAMKGSKAQMMKDCMAQQSAKNPDMSKSDMTKACHDQMKTNASK
jgi:hypothetical protein